MKMALLICGQPRTFEFCFPSLKKHILDVYQPDVFICTDDQKERIKELYQPTAMKIMTQEMIMEQAMKIRTSLGHFDAIPEAVISITYKHLMCQQMKTDYENEHGFIYDAVIMTRFDVKFAKIQTIGKAKENMIYVPLVDAYPVVSDPRPGIHWLGYSTHLCWMSSAVANRIPETYFAQINWAKRATEAQTIWGNNPEHVLKYFCDHNGITAEFVNIRMMLIRGISKNPLGYDHKPIAAYPEFA